MKKFAFIFIVLMTMGAGLFAQSNTDPFDKLAEKLLDDFEGKGCTIAVKLFNSDLSNQERKKISKSVQFALYCTDDVEIVASAEDADYVCSGNIETDGPNYIVSAKLVDNYDGTTVSKARQKVSKKYYSETAPKKTETVVIQKEDDIDAEDVLGAIILGSVIGGVFHAVTEPHHVAVPVPVPSPKPTPKPKPRPNRP